MNSATSRTLVLLFILAGLFTGCSKKEVTSLQRKQGASLASEASFAATLHDYARAESLLTEAVKVCPDTPAYWLSLGSVRRRLGNRSGAKDAYEEMLEVVKDRYKQDSKDPGPLLQQVYALALLGRMDDAKDALAKAQKNHPTDRAVRGFVESKQLDRLPDDPTFKEISL